MTAYRVGPADDPDRYELTEMRSRGGEGELWGGWVTADGQQLPVAVKVYHPSASQPIATLYERVRGQAEILRSLDHPNLVKVREAFVGPALHEAGQADASTAILCLVMNWVPGENLESSVARNPAHDPLDATRIIARVADAVDVLHSGRSTGGTAVLHRDIKPANVIVEGADVRLVDFGLVQFASGDASTIAGTPSYIAPEVLAGAAPTAASDRFGLGAVAYFLFTGATPDINNPAQMRANLQRVNGITDKDGFADHVMAMVDRDPSRRPVNVVEWAQGLAVGAVSRTFAAVPPAAAAVASAPPPKKKSKALVGAIVAVVALLLLAGGAFALTRGSDDETAASTTTTRPPTTTTTRPPTTTTTRPVTTSSSSTTSTTPPTDPSGVTSGGVQYLSDFEPVAESAYDLSTGQANVSGTVYTRSVMMDPNQERVAYGEYDLGRKYKTFSGVVGLRDDVPTGTTMKVEIYGDGVALFDQTLGLGQPVAFDVDVTNVLRLRLQVTDLSSEYPYTVYAVFADAKLTR